jgi:hypothetical protein
MTVKKGGGGINLYTGLSHSEVNKANKCTRITKETDTENFFHKKLKLQFSQNKQGYFILFLLKIRTVHTSILGILNMTAS